MSQAWRGSGLFTGVHFVAMMGCEPTQVNQTMEAGDGLADALGVATVTTWQTCDDSRLEVGLRDVELFGVSGAALTARKELVVANEGSGELLFFDREGELVRTTGGRGAGPGEFMGVNLVPDWSSDSLLVFDLTQQRLSVMDPEGEFVRISHMATSR